MRLDLVWKCLCGKFYIELSALKVFNDELQGVTLSAVLMIGGNLQKNSQIMDGQGSAIAGIV